MNRLYKKVIVLKSFLCLVFLSPVLPLQAGDFFIGVRTWQAAWSPGVIRKIKHNGDVRTLRNLSNGALTSVPVATDTVSGLYGGPLISYITDNRKWSFSLVGLTGKSSRQGYVRDRLQSSYTYLKYVTNSAYSRPRRRDLDATVAYGLTGRFKVFTGYKRQGYVYEKTITRRGALHFNDGMGGFVNNPLFGTGKHNISHSYAGPVIGLAYSFPLSITSAISLSLGYFKAGGDSRENSYYMESNGHTGSRIHFKYVAEESNTPLSMYGSTFEITYTGAITSSLYIQVGYRGQFSTLRVDENFAERSLDYEVIRNNSNASADLLRFTPGKKFQDRFHGFSFSLIQKL